MKRKERFQIIWVSILLAVLLSACSGFLRTMPPYPRAVRGASNTDEARFSDAVNSFYKARNLKEAETAVLETMRLAPDAARTHEISSRLALLKGNEEAAWRHLYLALATPENKEVSLHLNDLLGISMTSSQYRETLELLEDILKAHPNEELKRKAAAFVASWQRRLNGDAAAAEAALSMRGTPINFALISAFENEDGQGFAVEYPPEREIDYTKEYTGTQLPARWRMNVPLDHQQNLSLSDLVSPESNVIAYAATYVFTPRAGDYAIHITTTDAVKMWVNDIQVLSEQQVEEDSVDQFRVPIALRKGWNKVLVKSCQDRGSWLLGLLVTDMDGALVANLKSSVGSKEISDGLPPGDGYDFTQDINRQLDTVKEPFRKKYYAIQMAKRAGLLNAAQNMADEYRTAIPTSLFARLESALTSWDAGQLGTTIDILNTLIAENGTDAPWLLMLRAEYFDEQERPEKVREDLLAAIDANPDFRTARNHLAENYENEEWTENYLKACQADLERWPDDTQSLWGLASAYRALGRRDKAEQVYQTILNNWKGASDILKKMTQLALIDSNFDTAIRYQKSLIELFPSTPGYYLKLGDVLRRSGRFDEAAKAYERCLKIDDNWSTPVKRLGALAYEKGDINQAVSLWRKSLELDPDDHSLADRLEYVAPEADSLFDAYVPDSKMIKKILASQKNIQIHPGSDVVFLLDHAVGQLGKDGSSRQVVTQIITAANDTGRDELTKHVLPIGRIRIKKAYAVDPDGTWHEASSVRHRTVRFRELKVGSTVVIQFRHDEYPGGYLSRHLHRRWFFNAPNNQFEDSHYILLVPKEIEIKEFGLGSWERQEIIRGNRRIIDYRARHVPPIAPEPFTPSFIDLLDQVIVSSIPDWSTIAGWDAALLLNAFRSTPETKELALSLTRDANTKQEKLDAITRFVMREIRYQQDYENTIAGVKPHTAPVVLQRAYGDCKDKSVLLMTLAKEVGIDTRFALLRTTGVGRFIKELPSLQFNHAIVYIPAQEGFEKPFFVDATPDTLDLKTLRPDSQNTWAMVIDPTTEAWEFIRIPLAPAEQQYTVRRIRIEPKINSASTIEMNLTAQGPAAAAVRSVLRNKDDTRMFTSQLANSLFPGSLVEDISFSGEDDIVRPVTLMMSLTSESVIRHQGDDIIIELPKSENLSKFTSLAERHLPLQINLYLSLIEIEDEVIIPNGYAVRYLPEALQVDNQFFSLERRVDEDKEKIKLKIRFAEKKQKISAKEYPEFRNAVSKIIDILGQDIVFTPVKTR
ncbi:MAG: tetratricopeptide repeat protein [Proteobacteria bacterium]|nr:tetratricopeptide repeat protein [Pseudomonadota bacterium]